MEAGGVVESLSHCENRKMKIALSVWVGGWVGGWVDGWVRFVGGGGGGEREDGPDVGGVGLYGRPGFLLRVAVVLYLSPNPASFDAVGKDV